MRYIARVLSFRFTGDDVASVQRRHLVVGLIFTWLAGIGRYWDNPRASVLQHLGLGSVIYVLALSSFLWLLLWPLRPARWSLLPIMTFIAAVSPPALLYAIPVERFMTLETAQSVNFWFLAAVALWRVALYFLFLKRYARLRSLALFVAAFLPLTVIIFSLTALNLERVVFELMAGNDRTPGTPADGAYALLFLLTVFSIYMTPALVVAYGIAIYQAFAARRGDRPSSG